jgi:cation:H+ antiporter
MTGAMVFQSTFPVSVGLLFTDWKIKGLALISALVALGLGCLYLFFIKFFKNLNPILLLFSGVGYIFYILLVLFTFK